MECRKVESVEQSFEIHVCFTDSATIYERLRFGLQASAWFPRQWGIVVWSALHVLLIVAAPPLVVLVAVATFMLSALVDILTVPIWLLLGFGLTVLCFTLMCLVLVCVVMKFFWSFITCSEWAEDLWESFSTSTLQIWRKFVRPVIEHFLVIREGCLSWKFAKDFMAEWPFPVCRAYLTRWCEEVMHMHEATA